MGQMCCGRTKDGKQLPSINKDDRSCTDRLFLILFIVSWAVLIGIMDAAGKAGADPNKIINGVDMRGRICGKSSGVTNMPYAAWPNPTVFGAKICVSSCSHTSNPDSKDMHYLYNSVVFANRYCIPTFNITGGIRLNITVSGSFESAANLAGRAVGDLLTAWTMLLASPLIALIVTFGFMVINRKFTGCMVYACIGFMIFGALLAAAALLAYGQKAAASSNPKRAQAAQILGYIVLGALGIFILVLCFLRHQIKIAVEVVKEASKLISDVKTLIFFPLVPVVLLMGYFVFWVAVALWIFSVTELVEVDAPDGATTFNCGFPFGFRRNPIDGTICNPFDLSPPRNLNYAIFPSRPGRMMDFRTLESWRYASAYHVFHLLWVVQFIFYYCYLVFAGAAADWYFTPYQDGEISKPRGNGVGKLGDSPVWDSAKRAIRYNLGTIATCSFIIAVVQFLRLVITYLEAKTKGDPPNKAQQILFSCLQCGLKCLECCLDKINKNALIWTAIFGDGFCTSACSSFALMWRNLGRVAAINVVSGTILFLTKLSVALVTTGICAILLANLDYYQSNLSSITVPCIFCFVFAYSVAALFMIVYNAVIDTVFFCFLVDEEHNKGGKMLASSSLLALVDNYKAESEKKADNAKKTHAERPVSGTPAAAS